MFRFVIQTGTSFDSDICLDDIKLVDAAATSISVGENITLGSSAYSGAYGLVSGWEFSTDDNSSR